MRDILGGKGANLAEMTKIGLPVPQGMTISTEACNDYFAQGNKLPVGLLDQVWDNLAVLEEQIGKKFGDVKNPLLVSVRSGAAISMPGMMDTVLNLGLNDTTVVGLAELTGDKRFALDCYRRFIQMYSNVVMGIEGYKFDQIIEKEKEIQGVREDYQLSSESLETLIKRYKDLVRREKGIDFPQEPKEQLILAISAVFQSWGNPRAIVYRQINRIPDDIGTAVNVQSMVFGNMGPTSGTGVAFTRNPATGARELYGEYLINAQGEDVVAGIRTPQHISRLKEDLPDAFKEFIETCELLENHYKDMQDIEFTIENGHLYILQTRNAKRTTQAAVRCAVEMARDGFISRDEAVLRIDPYQLDQLLHPSIDPKADLDILAKGLPASPGAVSGSIVFTADEAEARGNAGDKVILVRNETTPDDIHGIVTAKGVLTSRGGMTSHAAVVARGMGRSCVCGCEALKIDLEAGVIHVDGAVLKENDIITIDGSTGNVIRGEVPVIEPELGEYFQQLLKWCDEIAAEGGMNVHANADNPRDAKKALEFGATGIGLCRTEHMFFEGEKIKAMRSMILAEDLDGRRNALKRLLPLQKEDFKAIFREMHGLPVTVRLLDPPLHEFVPHDLKGQEEMAKEMGVSVEKIQERVASLSEQNPMLGHRGCRLGNTYPEITEMQTEAILSSCLELKQEGIETHPEIMVPLIGSVDEFKEQERVIRNTAERLFERFNDRVDYTVGTMIEVPRATLTADKIASSAEFFSFGTNDLTQLTYGFSRDDIASFLPVYLEKKLLKVDPFQVLDEEGVGKLIRYATENGKQMRPTLKCGICGEHGGEPHSVKFCHRAGLDYVSCSPFRVPIARVAAAQAAVEEA